MMPTLCTRESEDGGRLISAVLPGDPIGKPRQTRRDRWAQRPCVLEYRAWADRLRALVGDLPASPPVRVDVTAHVSLPPSWSKAKADQLAGQPHRQKPDIDNVVKAVLDALWPEGDQAIAWVVGRKLWSGQGQGGSLTVAIHYDPPREGDAR